MRTAPLLVFTCLFAASPVAAQTIRDTSFQLDTDERVLQQAVIVDAPVADVWRTLSTAEGLRTFAAPVMDFELRSGGRAHSNMDPKGRVDGPGTIRNEVLSFVPGKMLSIRIVFPESFPAAMRGSTSVFVAYTLEPQGPERTRVTLTTAGFGRGPDWDNFYRVWKACSAQTLEAMFVRFKTGPLDWTRPTPYTGHGNHLAGSRR